MSDDIRAIRKLVFTNVLYQLAIGLIMVGLGLTLILFMSFGLPEATQLLFQIMGLIVTIIGAFFVITALKSMDISNDAVVNSLENDPRRIVWFYSYIVINMPFGVKLFRLASIFVHFTDGKQVTLRVNEKKVDDIMNVLHKQLPHATMGYTVDREQLFKANPTLLYKD